MKKSVDILGLPVVSITEGKELGVVKELVINPVGGLVSALVVDDGKWYLGAKLLPFTSITGIGEYAVTVDSSNNILPVSVTPELEQLLSADVKVIGAKVLTKTGRIQGKVIEVIIDETGKIDACEMQETMGDITHIPAQGVITFGKNVLIVRDNDDASSLAVHKEVSPISVMAAPIVAHKEVSAIPVIPAPIATPNLEQTVTPTDTVKDVPTDDSAKKFDEKHRKYLLGKKANRRIETDNGMVIVEQGGEITEEVLQKAKLAGKFVELSMSIQ